MYFFACIINKFWQTFTDLQAVGLAQKVMGLFYFLLCAPCKLVLGAINILILNGSCIKTLRWTATRTIFNVSLTVRDKVTRQRPQTTTFQEEED